MAERKTGAVVKVEIVNDKAPKTLKVILKCTYSKKDKDGKLVKEGEGKKAKVVKLKPDDEVELPYAEAMDLIGRAFAIKAK